MLKVNEILKQYGLHPYCYKKMGKAILVETDKGKYIIKEKNRDRKSKIYQYLESRNFMYHPNIITNELDDYEMTEFIEEIDMPKEQKIMDLIDLVSLLHNKTTHYKEVDEDDYKKIYEDISNNIEYLTSYYNDLITIIETHIFMSPSEYLLARNISKVYAALNFCKGELDKWYEMIKDKRKQRLVVLHNNLELDHFIRNNQSYLISWNKSKIDLPIFDLYKLYKKHNLDYDFYEILKRYESHYKLFEDERKLLFILISLPDKIELNKKEYEMCKEIGNMIDSLFKTEKFLSPYYSEKTEQSKN